MIKYILLGFILHMLYLDAIIIYQRSELNKCPLEDIRQSAQNNECIEKASNITDRFKFKYFNIVELLRFEKFGKAKWNME